MATSRLSFTDLQNPLFLHPSDGPTSIIVSKLQGACDYRAWKRSFEIQLSAKRKLGFVDGSVLKSTTDPVEAIQWDTCNNMVISWIHNNISDNIKSSVLFIDNACDIWKQLEKRFSLTNGSRKYKLNKDLFSLRQNGSKVSDYFTNMSSLWEEIESMNVLPTVTAITPEIKSLLNVMNTIKEEGKLFQFLNGLDDHYGAQRSQLLMLNPLPSVEVACAAIQQEESQKEVLMHGTPNDSEAMATFSKGNGGKTLMCSACGRKGHMSDSCWETIGYPKWHYKYKPTQKNSMNKWTGTRNNNVRMANNAQSNAGNQQPVMMTAEQLNQLLKLIPRGDAKGTETDDEIDYSFSGMVSSGKKEISMTKEWIIDSGASDHMTSSLKNLVNVKQAPATFTITLPTGATTVITHIGDVLLSNGLKLENVLYVPTFNHNLLSIHKLAIDNKCNVVFHPGSCFIIDSVSKNVIGRGEIKQGLYYLTNEKMHRAGLAMTGEKATSTTIVKEQKGKVESEYTLWHQRLGHASISKMLHIARVKPCLYQEKDQVCLTCPMSKMTRLAFSASESRASKPFDLLHVDIWGPYKVVTGTKFRFFLTLVDDYSRVTWVYLLARKSDYLNTLMKFGDYVDTQYNSKLRIVRSDNALEFKDKACEAYFTKRGMVHQKSCPYTPQQNARVERKHRQVLEVSRALRFQSGLSLSFWGECVLTATYIINRLPNAALDFEVPYEVLTGKKVEYDELRIFGCLAIAHNAKSGDMTNSHQEGSHVFSWVILSQRKAINW